MFGSFNRDISSVVNNGGGRDFAEAVTDCCTRDGKTELCCDISDVVIVVRWGVADGSAALGIGLASDSTRIGLMALIACIGESVLGTAL